MLRLFCVGVLLVALLVVSGARAATDDPWAAARSALAELDYREALRLYAPLQAASTEGSAEWTEATFCVALARQQIQPLSKWTIDEAYRLFEQVVEKSGDQRYVARAMMNLGRILELRDFKGDTIDLPAAHGWYRRVLERFPNEPIASEAALRAAGALIMAYDAPRFESVRRGVAELETFLKERPNDPCASMMWQYLGDTYFIPLDDSANALRCYEQVDRLGWTDVGNQGPWYWRCSQLAEHDLNRPDVAAKYYAKIIIETPNSGKAYEALLALRRLGYPVPESPLADQMTPATQPREESR